MQRIGILYAVFRLSGAAGAYLSDAIHRAVGEASVYLVPLCLVASVLCLGFLVTPWVVILVVLNFFVSGVYPPIISDLLNRNLHSSQRATIISLSSVVSSLLNAAVDPALGRVADVFSLQATFRTAGLGVLVGMSVILAFLRSELRKDTVEGIPVETRST